MLRLWLRDRPGRSRRDGFRRLEAGGAAGRLPLHL